MWCVPTLLTIIFAIYLAGFLQVKENWKISGNLCGQGNCRKKYYFRKSRGNNLWSFSLQIYVV